jgi:hypothetical protein
VLVSIAALLVTQGSPAQAGNGDPPSSFNFCQNGRATGGKYFPALGIGLAAKPGPSCATGQVGCPDDVFCTYTLTLAVSAASGRAVASISLQEQSEDGTWHDLQFGPFGNSPLTYTCSKGSQASINARCDLPVSVSSLFIWPPVFSHGLRAYCEQGPLKFGEVTLTNKVGCAITAAPTPVHD